jgi:hypothetical protein
MKHINDDLDRSECTPLEEAKLTTDRERPVGNSSIGVPVCVRGPTRAHDEGRLHLQCCSGSRPIMHDSHTCGCGRKAVRPPKSMSEMQSDHEKERMGDKMTRCECSELEISST